MKGGLYEKPHRLQPKKGYNMCKATRVMEIICYKTNVVTFYYLLSLSTLLHKWSRFANILCFSFIRKHVSI